MVKFNDIDYPNSDKITKPSAIRPENAEFLRRLSPFDTIENDMATWFWIYKKERKENEKLINDIWSLFQTCGLDYFKHFENHKQYIGTITTNNYQKFPDFYIQKFFGRRFIGIVYFLFKYWIKFGDNQKAREFALNGIEISDGKADSKYEIEFKEYINAQKPSC